MAIRSTQQNYNSGDTAPVVRTKLNSNVTAYNDYILFARDTILGGETLNVWADEQKFLIGNFHADGSVHCEGNFKVIPEDDPAEVLSIKATGGAPLSGNVTLSPGTNLTMVENPATSTITINSVDPRKLVTLAVYDVTVTAFDTTYEIGVSFAATGVFADIGYIADMTCDESTVIIQENTNQKTPGKCYFVLYVPDTAPYGSYGLSKDLALTVTLAGEGWTGATSANITGTWDALTAVPTGTAEVTSIVPNGLTPLTGAININSGATNNITITENTDTNTALIDVVNNPTFSQLASYGSYGTWRDNGHLYLHPTGRLANVNPDFLMSPVAADFPYNYGAYNLASSYINAISVGAGGSGYTSTPTVSFYGGGGAPTATASIGGGAVTAIAITNAATQYSYTTAPTIVITGGGGAGATATAVLTGVLSSMNLTNAGSGYTSAPTVILTGGGGTGGAITAVVSGGVVTNLTVTNIGSGYTSAPTISFTGGGGSGAAANILIVFFLTSITVTAGGSGYGSAPTVSFYGGGLGGTTATANLASNAVTSITVNTGGSGYNSAPTVVISGGGGTGATATATIINPVTASVVADDTAPNCSGKLMRISFDGYIGAAGDEPQPGYGGFYCLQSYTTGGITGYGQYTKGTRCLGVVWAKIPVGRNLGFASNSTGVNGSYTWLTSTSGTGNWQRYVIAVSVDISGLFGSTNYFWISGGTATAFTWDIGLCAVIHVDDYSYLNAPQTLNVGMRQNKQLDFGDLGNTGNAYLASTAGSSVICGANALATNTTTGFIYCPSGAGAPTGVPVAQTGTIPMYIDTTNSKIWIYVNGAWKGVVVS